MSEHFKPYVEPKAEEQVSALIAACDKATARALAAESKLARLEGLERAVKRWLGTKDNVALVHAARAYPENPE